MIEKHILSISSKTNTRIIQVYSSLYIVQSCPCEEEYQNILTNVIFNNYTKKRNVSLTSKSNK